MAMVVAGEFGYCGEWGGEGWVPVPWIFHPGAVRSLLRRGVGVGVISCVSGCVAHDVDQCRSTWFSCVESREEDEEEVEKASNEREGIAPLSSVDLRWAASERAISWYVRLSVAALVVEIRQSARSVQVAVVHRDCESLDQAYTRINNVFLGFPSVLRLGVGVDTVVRRTLLPSIPTSALSVHPIELQPDLLDSRLSGLIQFIAR